MSQPSRIRFGSAGEIAGVYMAPPPPSPRLDQAEVAPAPAGVRVCPRPGHAQARAANVNRTTPAARPAPPALLRIMDVSPSNGPGALRSGQFAQELQEFRVE